MYTTPVSLLERLRQPSCPDAWGRFVDLYTPLLFYWARRAESPKDDAEDLVQDVFAALVRLMPEFSYDPQKTFRGWLRTIAVNRWRDRRRRLAHVACGLESAAVVDGKATDPAEQFWQKEYRGLLLQRALELMKTDFPDTWEAFYQVKIEGRSVPEIARERGVSANTLHQAIFRIMKRLRQELVGMLD